MGPRLIMAPVVYGIKKWEGGYWGVAEITAGGGDASIVEAISFCVDQTSFEQLVP